LYYFLVLPLLAVVNHEWVRALNYGQSLFLCIVIDDTVSAFQHALIYLVDYFDIFDRQYASMLFGLIVSTSCHNRCYLDHKHDRWSPSYGTNGTHNVGQHFSSALLADEVIDLDAANLDNYPGSHCFDNSWTVRSCAVIDLFGGPYFLPYPDEIVTVSKIVNSTNYS
jgi:hypothetical protein